MALEDVEVCFLATDDSSVHLEMEQALHTYGMVCRLVYTPAQEDSVNLGDINFRETLVFMTELFMLIDATYFVGTLDSNVGALAAVLRASPGGYNANKHYAQTYGVDRDTWYLR